MTQYPQSPEEFTSLIDRIGAEVAELLLETFDADDSFRLGMILVRLARERDLPIAIDVRKGTRVMFHVSLPGASESNAFWIDRKVRIVERFESPSLLVGLVPRSEGRNIEDDPWFDPFTFAAHGGCFPVQVTGVGMVGTVTVSGLPQVEDHELAVEALRELKATAKPQR